MQHILQTAQNLTFAKNVYSKREGVLSRFEKVQFLPVQSIATLEHRFSNKDFGENC